MHSSFTCEKLYLPMADLEKVYDKRHKAARYSYLTSLRLLPQLIGNHVHNEEEWFDTKTEKRGLPIYMHCLSALSYNTNDSYFI